MGAHGGSSAASGRRSRGQSLRLDEQLCFALYAASRAVTGWYRPILEKLGATYPQYSVLRVLYSAE